PALPGAARALCFPLCRGPLGPSASRSAGGRSGPMLAVVMTPLREQLLEILKQKGLRRLPEPIELASGELSSDFVDGKEALAHWEDLKVASDAIVETLRANGIVFDAVGGLTLGADALAVGIAAS